MFRGMGVRADRDDLTAKLTVAREDLLAGVRMSQSVFEAAGIDLDAFPFSIRSLRISSITSLYLA